MWQLSNKFAIAAAIEYSCYTYYNNIEVLFH
jgi:hypothetical protein